MGNSFDTAILDEPERFIEYAFKNNPDISHFGEFKQALDLGIAHAKGDIDEQTIISLFDHPKTKELIKGNVSSTEYQQLYGDGNVVQRVAVTPTKMVTITYKKIQIKSHQRAGHSVKTYAKGYKKWTPAETKFLKLRKVDKKLSPKKIMAEYNQHFKNTPRTESSLKTKIYRT